jgi:phage terminase small subunit
MTDASGIDKLTPKQQAFVEAYLECGSAAEAYRRAYSCANMAAATIQREATRLLANPTVDHTITTLRAQAANKAVLNRSYVLTGLMENAEVSLGRKTVKLRVHRKDKESGKVEVSEIEVSAHDAKAANQALIALGRTDEVRAFIDRIEATGKDGASLTGEPDSRSVARAILGILKEAQIEGAVERADDDAEEVSEIDEVASPCASSTAGDDLPPATAAGATAMAPAAAPSPAEPPRPRPTKLAVGDKEVLLNEAWIAFVPEFDKHAVYDGLGRLHGYRRTLDDARALAGNIKPPPPLKEEDPYGRR